MSLSHALEPVAPPLRGWQRRALAQARELYAAGGSDVLVTATPGAGKTRFALALAAELLAARTVDRLIVVAPTDHLRTQWSAAAAEVGIALDPALPNSVGPVRADVAGYVTTYAQVAAKPLLHRRRTETRKSLVVLDEIHHAGDGLSWGVAVEEAFEPAVRRLALSGTPFRTDPTERIPFVRYTEDGDGGLRSVADAGYGYRDALRDGVVRPVVFAAYAGVARWRNSAGEVVAASLAEPLTRDAEAAAWRTALDPGGRWVPHVLAAMDERIDHLRAHGMPDAAGLVLASDQDAARAYAGIVERVTGRAPALILSDDPKASARLSRFAAGDERVAVCVRMISEGVDVPRAAVLAWLTSYRTPLFFAQAVGRVVRSRRPGESATVFLPAVRPLLALAAELETERNHVLRPPEAGEDLDPLPAREPSDGVEVGSWEALDAEAAFAHVLHGGQAHLGEPVAQLSDGELADDRLSDDDADYLGLPGLLSAEQTARLLSRRDEELRRRATVHRVADDAPEPSALQREAASWEHAAALRREVNKLVAQVAARSGRAHGTVHAEVRAAVPGPPSASAPAALLAARRDHLLARL